MEEANKLMEGIYEGFEDFDEMLDQDLLDISGISKDSTKRKDHSRKIHAKSTGRNFDKMSQKQIDLLYAKKQYDMLISGDIEHHERPNSPKALPALQAEESIITPEPYSSLAEEKAKILLSKDKSLREQLESKSLKYSDLCIYIEHYEIQYKIKTAYEKVLQSFLSIKESLSDEDLASWGETIQSIETKLGHFTEYEGIGTVKEKKPADFKESVLKKFQEIEAEIARVSSTARKPIQTREQLDASTVSTKSRKSLICEFHENEKSSITSKRSDRKAIISKGFRSKYSQLFEMPSNRPTNAKQNSLDFLLHTDKLRKEKAEKENKRSLVKERIQNAREYSYQKDLKVVNKHSKFLYVSLFCSFSIKADSAVYSICS